MTGIIASELIRLARPRLLLTWFGLTALFAALINSVMFTSAADTASMPTAGPGVTFADAATLASAEGPFAGLSAAASMFGVVTLSFWALAIATDYSSGLIRLIVSAEPNRWKLLLGKVLALTLLTAAATTVALVVCAVSALPAASSAGISTAQWGTDLLPIIAGAWANSFLSMLVWGVAGLALAAIFRSSAVAISIGVGYVLVVESVLRQMFDGGATWLLGSTMSALAAGGTAEMSYATALGLSAVYIIVGVGVATVVVTRRDVTD